MTERRREEKMKNVFEIEICLFFLAVSLKNFNLM